MYLGSDKKVVYERLEKLKNGFRIEEQKGAAMKGKARGESPMEVMAKEAIKEYPC